MRGGFSLCLDDGRKRRRPGFGEPAGGLSAELDAARMAASDAAFAAVAWITAALCLLSAIMAWLTVSGEGAAKARDAGTDGIA